MKHEVGIRVGAILSADDSTDAVAAALCRAANARWPDPADHCLLPAGSCPACKATAERAIKEVSGDAR